MKTGIKFDTTELNRAINAASLLSDKLPSEIVNQKGYFIFARAAKNMKSVERWEIDKELGAAPAHVLTTLKNGKYSRAKRNVQMFFGQGEGSTEGFSLLAAIVQSRGNSPFKGKTREAGAAAMQEAMQKVYSARQKSRAYFKRTLQIAREVYRRAKWPSSKVISKSFLDNSKGGLNERRGKIADVSLAKSGSRASSSFWIKSPEHDTNVALDKNLSPVLQAAVDAESEETFRHEAEKQYKAGLNALGIKTT